MADRRKRPVVRSDGKRYESESDAMEVRMSYEEQLSAAKFRAERDQARQEVKELREELEAMRPRLMPDGMEWLVEAWPRFEDDLPVRLLDDFERYGEENVVSTVTMYSDGSFALNCRAYSKGERVNRPAPKALDADGAEIRVGDTVYRKSDGKMVEVAEVGEKTFTDSDGYVRPGDGYTHRAPVLAADGRPLEVGQTVWDWNGDGYVVERIYSGTTEPDFPGHTVACRRPDDIVTHMFKPSQLTHQRPVVDTWERLEEDATMPPWDYCEGHGLFEADSAYKDLPTNERFARDLVSRARALAGVSE